MRSTPLLVRNIIKEVAAETGKSYQLVEDIFYHQFEFLKDCMEAGDKANLDSYHNILLKHLGTFYFSEKVILAIENAKIRKQQNLDNSGEDQEEEFDDCED